MGEGENTAQNAVHLSKNVKVGGLWRARDSDCAVLRNPDITSVGDKARAHPRWDELKLLEIDPWRHPGTGIFPRPPESLKIKEIHSTSLGLLELESSPGLQNL